MEFFIPIAQDAAQSEQVYEAIAQFVDAPIIDERIWKLRWKHNGMDMQCEVGQSLPAYYRTGREPVLAIFDCGNLYKICTPNRGGIRGEPVLAGKDFHSSATHFSNDTRLTKQGQVVDHNWTSAEIKCN